MTNADSFPCAWSRARVGTSGALYSTAGGGFTVVTDTTRPLPSTARLAHTILSSPGTFGVEDRRDGADDMPLLSRRVAGRGTHPLDGTVGTVSVYDAQTGDTHGRPCSATAGDVFAPRRATNPVHSVMGCVNALRSRAVDDTTTVLFLDGGDDDSRLEPMDGMHGWGLRLPYRRDDDTAGALGSRTGAMIPGELNPLAVFGTARCVNPSGNVLRSRRWPITSDGMADAERGGNTRLTAHTVTVPARHPVLPRSGRYVVALG